MPDPTKKTLSASQLAGLFGHSPYVTKFLLWNHFKHGLDIDADDNILLDWGRFMQPFMFKQVQSEFTFDRLEENATDLYYRHPTLPIGCTPDGYAWDAKRGGLGVVETKFVGWQAFKDGWTEFRAPLHYEIQLQAQMMVPHPEHGPPQWGMFAVAEHGQSITMRYYNRDHIKQIQDEIAERSVAFFKSLDGEPPAVTESPIEMPGIRQLWPVVEPTKHLDKRDEPFAEELTNLMSMYDTADNQEYSGKKTKEDLKPKIIELMKDAATLRVPCWKVKQSRVNVKPSVMTLPADLRKKLTALRNAIAEGESPLNKSGADSIPVLDEAINWSTVTKSGGIQVRLSLERIPGETAPDPFSDIDVHLGG
jgi:predicted phage-related endonuclease